VVDTLSPRARSERMSRVRGKHTKPEKFVRKLLRGLGYVYGLHTPKLPGKPDLVFARRKKVIFVHGCFWHRHPSRKCALARLPKSRLDFWLPKLMQNRDRDKKNQRRLRKLGWRYLIIWECQLKSETMLAGRVKRFLGRRDTSK
jgi:DNA mismatch endonuclease (patch repair protein)